MPPRRYLRGFTLCVPLPDDGGGGLVDGVPLRSLAFQAVASQAEGRSFDLVIRVEIRLSDPSEGGQADSFPVEVYVIPFPETRSERRRRIRAIIGALLTRC